ncbi:class I SAM-dependent methyltransferase [Shewanella sp. 202IG2-18]|uniref:class I SAM-dependent methyltransferase n=1 Tax=Parashewanella hymeniacidonis TaxID=2807618 RepID=UPI00195F2982|nr:class I SAM-dependent methyltransferase [Parashewanella hymeniacidonis]MBM7070739.1 class I SAM-dependent methyltransferase [Parashewanella hymeniacidonis]
MVEYYNRNAQEFFDGTISVNMLPLYEKFTPLLPEAGSIIDAGCGSGRDSKFFAEQGFHVTAFDASASLVELAKVHTKLPVIHSTFLNFEAKEKSVDGIWACASLLHVPQAELNQTFIHLAKFLKEGGLFYCSFKYGDNEIERDGRCFTNVDEVSLPRYLEISNLDIKEHWITSDLRPGRENEKWLNAILVKSA